MSIEPVAQAPGVGAGCWGASAMSFCVPQSFVTADVDQSFLLPPDVRDWLPEDDLAWVVMEAVAELDLWELYGAYRADGHGRAAFDPAMMTGVLLSAYACGVCSSRQMARRCVRDVAFRVLAGSNLAPNHCTISRFRACHEQALAGLLAQVIGLCARVWLVDLGLLAVDGTKIAADPSWSANKTEGALGHLVEEAEVAYAVQAAALLEQHAVTDAAEDALFGPQPRRPEVMSCRRVCAARPNARPACRRPRNPWSPNAPRPSRPRTPRSRRGRCARQPRGASGAPAELEGVRPASGKAPRANTTDPDSRAMRGPHALVQGYNAQAVVTGGQVIVGVTAINVHTDRNLLCPVLAVAASQLRQAGLPPALPDPEDSSSAPRPAAAQPAQQAGAGRVRHRAGRRRIRQRSRLRSRRGRRVPPARPDQSRRRPDRHHQQGQNRAPGTRTEPAPRELSSTTETSHQARPNRIRATRTDRRTSVRPDQVRAGLPAILPTRTERRKRQMVAGLHRPQPAQAPPQPLEPEQHDHLVADRRLTWHRPHPPRSTPTRLRHGLDQCCFVVVPPACSTSATQYVRFLCDWG